MEILTCGYADNLVYNQPVGRLVQLVRTPLLHRGGRGFESLTAHRILPYPSPRLEEAFLIPACFNISTVVSGKIIW